MEVEMIYRTHGVCAKELSFDIVEGKVTNVNFLGGCNGNLKAIGLLVEGMPVETLISKLKGNTCGPRPTSCTDQLALAVEAAIQ